MNIKGGTLSGNSAQNYGGGVFLYDATNVTISGGTISENKASQGGGVYLWPTSAVKQTNGSIENNVANVGGGVCGGTYTMTGGVIKDNNNSLTKEARLSARGDGVYVGTAFNLGNDAVISTNNDVYLVKGSSTPKEGRYINVISPYTGASTVNPIQIHSEDITIEEANIIGTQLVHYTADTNGETAAAKADADGIFVPSWKMPEGLVIGQSKETGKTDWMTYVPAVKIQYQWVSTDNPTDVTPLRTTMSVTERPIRRRYSRTPIRAMSLTAGTRMNSVRFRIQTVRFWIRIPPCMASGRLHAET